MSEPEPVPRCVVCGSGDDDHDEKRHPFTPPGTEMPNFFGRNRGLDRRQPAGFDAVLRTALIDAGILTPDQLIAAAEKVALIMGSQQGGVTRGRGSDPR